MAGNSSRAIIRATVSWLTRSRSATSLIVYQRGSVICSCVMCVVLKYIALDAHVKDTVSGRCATGSTRRPVLLSGR